jgi:DNA adenine methylase
MVYQGSKNKISKYLLPIIERLIVSNNIDTYIEPMAGGCNLIDKVSCKNKIASDINSELISLLQYMKRDPSISIAPSQCSFDHYCDVRDSRKYKNGKYTQEYISLIGYCASYGGRYYDGGYGRNSDGSSVYTTRLNNIKEQAILLSDVEIYERDYRYYKGYKGCLFYFDPPYRGTKKYSKQSINYEEFYEFIIELAKDNIVLMSEYNYINNEHFECIWSMPVNVQQKSTRDVAEIKTERLYIIK